MRRVIFSLVGVLAISVGHLGGAAGAVAAVTPASSGAVQAYVDDVSCSAPRACTAVGDYENSRGSFLPLVMRWNGKAWARQSAPAGGTIDTFLFGVSCPSAAYCLAVGQTEVNVRGNPFAQATPFVEQWNGTRWSVVPGPRKALASIGFLNGVSCPSARSCEIVGDKAVSALNVTLLAARWNGKSWARQAVSMPTKGATGGALLDISCSSVTHCAAVGDDGGTNSSYPVVAAWNGKSWTTRTAPLPKGVGTPPDAALNAVSCGSALSCTALGSSITGTKTISYSASGSGTSWKNAPVVLPKGATGASIGALGISCVAGTATWCMAVGSYSAHGKTLVLAESWNGRAWSLTAAPANSTQPATDLYKVSCRASTTCQAVGDDGASQPPGLSLTFAEGWNGKSWAIEHTPQPPPGSNESRGTWRPWSALHSPQSASPHRAHGRPVCRRQARASSMAWDNRAV